MNTERYEQLLNTEISIAACGCGGACSLCQSIPRPTDEAERTEFEAELCLHNII